MTVTQRRTRPIPATRRTRIPATRRAPAARPAARLFSPAGRIRDLEMILAGAILAIALLHWSTLATLAAALIGR